MDIKRFKESLVPLLTNSSGDGPFSTLRVATRGMSGIRTAKIINFACRCMNADEFYLEIGTFAGYTLISAGYQSNAMCVGVDDFSLEEQIRPESRGAAKELLRTVLNKHLEAYGSTNHKFIESDFRNVVLSKESEGKLGVLFIDAKHDSKEVEEAMAKFEPYLAPKAVIIFDDVQFNGIPSALQKLWQSGEYEMLLYAIATTTDTDEKIHMNKFLDEHIANGICIMTRKEKVNA